MIVMLKIFVGFPHWVLLTGCRPPPPPEGRQVEII
jgi:hypothetical protein